MAGLAICASALCDGLRIRRVTLLGYLIVALPSILQLLVVAFLMLSEVEAAAVVLAADILLSVSKLLLSVVEFVTSVVVSAMALSRYRQLATNSTLSSVHLQYKQ